MAKKVTETEIKYIISSEITNSIGFMGGALSGSRKKSLEYYMGEKLGTEIDGRSQVVSTDVSDTIETILPNLLRVFTSSDQVVKCEPVKAEDVLLARFIPIIVVAVPPGHVYTAESAVPISFFVSNLNTFAIFYPNAIANATAVPAGSPSGDTTNTSAESSIRSCALPLIVIF